MESEEPDQPREQPLDRMGERPDLDALRRSYEHPSRFRLRLEKLGSGMLNRTVLTYLLALAIIAALVFGYLQLT